MKRITVFGTWSLTLLIGLFVSSVTFQNLYMGAFLTGVAAVFSAPYLILMIAIAPSLKGFWNFQAVHLVLAVLISMVVLLIDEDFISDLFWLAFCYFVVAFIIHFVVWKKQLGKELDENDI